MHIFKVFTKTKYSSSTSTHIPVFTSRKRLVCFAPYITVSLEQYFLSKIIVNFYSLSEKFQIHEYYIGYIGLDMLAVELPQLLHYAI